jgi:hypothetical protein
LEPRDALGFAFVAVFADVVGLALRGDLDVFALLGFWRLERETLAAVVRLDGSAREDVCLVDLEAVGLCLDDVDLGDFEGVCLRLEDVCLDGLGFDDPAGFRPDAVEPVDFRPDGFCTVSFGEDFPAGFRLDVLLLVDFRPDARGLLAVLFDSF